MLSVWATCLAISNCTREVRWHFTIYHPEWGETIVGSECAENLSIGPEVVALKSYLRRLKTFIASPRWEPTRKGIKIIERDAFVLIFQKNGVFKIKIDDKWGDVPFSGLEVAKHKVFEVLEHRRRKEEKMPASLREDGYPF